MKSYIIIAGLNDKETKKQEIETGAAREIIAGIILQYAEGATLTDCSGIYTHCDGSGAVVYENSIKAEISGISKRDALKIAGEIKAALNQESVYFAAYRAGVLFL